MSITSLLERFFALRQSLDARCAELYRLHAPHLSCKAGCDMCCMEFSVLPIEYYAIRQQAASMLHKGNAGAGEGECPFLVDHRCVIYPARPLICRTQGLPLLFMGDEGWELSACELNFTRFNFEDFTEENTFPQDTWNSRMYLLNKEFLNTPEGKAYKANELIPLRRLLDKE